MNRVRTVLCSVVFGLLYFLVMAFTLYFTVDVPMFSYSLDWEQCEIVDSAGQARAFDASAYPPPALGTGETYRFTAHLPPADEIPEIYQTDSYLLTEINGDIRLLLDVQEIYRGNVPVRTENVNREQLHLYLEPQDAGKTLVMLYRPDGDAGELFPPYLRFTSEKRLSRMYAAMNHSYAIPTGAYILAFLIVSGIFLVGLAIGTPDWSLPVLAFAECTAAIWVLFRGIGDVFLPRAVFLFFAASWTPLVPILLMLLYLGLNRKRRFWEYFGRIVLCSLLALGAGALIFWLMGGPLPDILENFAQQVAVGDFDSVLKWVLTYLVAVCSATAAYGLMQDQVAVHNEKLALTVQNDLILKNFDQIQRSVQGTALMRHEWKNNIASLLLLAEQGDLEQLKAKLDQLGHSLNRLSAKAYSHNLTIDTILRSVAARAEEQDIRFSASAPVPAVLDIDATDLCSFLLNLLDNALEGAARAKPADREIECSIQFNQGYLAIRCENTYAGDLRADEAGMPQTTKSDREGHGFGLRNMRQIAKKYKGMFDVSYTQDRFTVNAALKLG